MVFSFRIGREVNVDFGLLAINEPFGFVVELAECVLDRQRSDICTNKVDQ